MPRRYGQTLQDNSWRLLVASGFTAVFSFITFSIVNAAEGDIHLKSSIEMVSGDDLRLAIFGHMLRRIDAGAHSPDVTEIFHNSYEWEADGYRAPLRGVYKIGRDRFCVEYPKAVFSCRFLYRSSDGRYFVRKVDKKTAELLPVSLTAQ